MNQDQIEGQWQTVTRSQPQAGGAIQEQCGIPRFTALAHIMKWVSIPALLAASLFSYTTARYEPFLIAFVIAGALVFAERAVRSRDYSRAAGLIAVAAAFVPVSLAVKIFLVMGLICIASLAALRATFRTQPARVV